jgi:carbon starvation protein
MLWESFLAVLVIMAVGGGLGLGLEKDGSIFTGVDAFRQQYSSWAAFSGIDDKLEAFVIGASNLFESFGIPLIVSKSLIAVFIVSFANTTLDSAARIQRLSLQEIFRDRQGKVRRPMNNRYIATAFVVVAAMIMAFIRPGATGAMILWPLFGSLNQLLAALALGIVTVWLYRKKKNILITLLPMIFVLLVTVWAMVKNLAWFLEQGDLTLVVLSLIILLLTLWLLAGGLLTLGRQKTTSTGTAAGKVSVS